MRANRAVGKLLPLVLALVFVAVNGANDGDIHVHFAQDLDAWKVMDVNKVWRFDIENVLQIALCAHVLLGLANRMLGAAIR